MGTHWWVTDVLQRLGPAYLAAWVIWVIVSITLHELAHGWAAMRRGDDTPAASGHMTWNPLVHMGGMSLLAFALTGIAWGQMPIDASRMRGRHAEAWVAFCGPLMNFCLAAVCIVGTVAAVLVLGGAGSNAQQADLLRSLRVFFGLGCSLNVFLGLFNLLPAPPLDGSRILASYSRQYREGLMTQGGQFFGLALFVVAFFLADRVIGDLGVRGWRRAVGAILDGLAQAGVGPGGGGFGP